MRRFAKQAWKQLKASIFRAVFVWTPHKAAAALSLAWIAGLCWLLRAVSLNAAWQSLEKLREMDLNNIGDFLAGVVSPLGLIWLVATVWQQVASQRSTFKLELFEKRFDVYQTMRRLLDEMYDAGQGTMTSEVRDRFLRTADQARFLCGDDVNEAMYELWMKAQMLSRASADYARLLRQPDEDVNPLDKEQLLERVIGLERWFLQEMNGEKMRKLFDPYLKMPNP